MAALNTGELGLVSKTLPQKTVDGQEGEVRLWTYRETLVMSRVRKQHLLADQGFYRMTNNASQSGILSSAATGFVATTPAMIIYNNDSVANANARSIYIDFLNLVTTVVGSAASGLVNLQAALYLDPGGGNRYSSGGTNITANITNPNGNAGSTTVAQVYFGALTATAASSSVRALCPLRVIRPSVSGTVLDVVGETKWFNFGGVEGALNGSITAANANFITVPMPALEVGPNQSALLYLWQNVGATNVAATYAPELAWWEE